MRIARRVGLGLLATILLATPVMTSAATDGAPNGVDFARLKETAGLDLGTPEGMNYMKSHKKDLEAAINAAFGQCSNQVPAGKTVAFEFIVGVGADGMPQEVLVRPEDPFGACFGKEFASNKIGAPPKLPFHVYVNMGAGK